MFSSSESFPDEILIKNNEILRKKILKLKNQFSNPSNILSNKNIRLKNINTELQNENSKLKEENIQLKKINKDINNQYELLGLPIKKLQVANDEIIKKIIDDEEYTKLLSHENFDVKYLFDYIYKILNRCNDDKIVEHVVNNCSNLNIEVNLGDFTSNRLIHLFCRHSNSELIKYLINKGIELECPDKCEEYPIHIICQRLPFEMIKYIINKGVNTKSNPKIDLIGIINGRRFTSDEKKELISMI